MTSLNRTDLKAKFESGDAPQGSDYADLIDSFVSLADTSQQTMQGGISFSGGLSAASITGGTGSFTSTVSAASVWGTTLNANSVSAQSMAVSAISAPASGLDMRASLNFVASYLKETVASVACSGTTQAGGYAVNSTINVLRTVTTGQQDSLTMPGFYPGATFVFINHTTGSARLFPPSGGAFDAGSTNAQIDIGPRGGTFSRIVVYCETSTIAHSVRGSN